MGPETARYSPSGTARSSVEFSSVVVELRKTSGLKVEVDAFMIFP
jgi:hypothetical protein